MLPYQPEATPPHESNTPQPPITEHLYTQQPYEAQSRATPPFGLPTVPTPPPTSGRRARRFSAAMLILALTGGAVGGGAVGTAATARWLLPTTQGTSAPSGNIATNNTSTQPVSLQAQSANSVAGAVFKKANPSVVEVLVPNGSGSGFVVDQRGYILTNNHVIDGASQIQVEFSTGEQASATILGTDSGNDLALLKVDLPADIPVAVLADSDQTQIGETAIAIGSPFGLQASVTQGIISAVHRNWAPDGGRVQRNLIQTDAAINPGNSGGPLLNADGEVIGINTQIESPVRGSVGVGFAIPINTAKQLFTQLEAGKHLEPVWLGISGRELDATTAKELGLKLDAGVLVAAVVPNSPAAQAGLQGGQNTDSLNGTPNDPNALPTGGDIITAIDGKTIKSIADIGDQLAGHNPGDTVKVTIERDGQQRTVTVTLQAWPTNNMN